MKDRSKYHDAFRKSYKEFTQFISFKLHREKEKLKDREDKWTKLEQLAKRNPSYHCNGDNSLSNSSACSPSGNDADVEDFDIYERIEIGAKSVSTNHRQNR